MSRMQGITIDQNDEYTRISVSGNATVVLNGHAYKPHRCTKCGRVCLAQGENKAGPAATKCPYCGAPIKEAEL